MRLDFYISELLYSHDCVIVPGLGGFVAHERGAFLNPAQHTFAPPARKLAFNAGLRISDGILAQAISRTRGISFNDAMDLIQLVVEDIIQRLKSGETIEIEKVGTLVYDKEGNLQFEPETNENYLPSSFGLTLVHSPAIRRDEKKSGKPSRQSAPSKSKADRKSRWRLLELVPAAAILALLAFNPRVTRDLNASLASFSPFGNKTEVNTSPVTTEVKSEELPVITAPEETVTDTQISEEKTSPATIETAVDTTRVSMPEIKSAITPESGNYLVIGGCFREESNALNFVQQAQEAGFEASITGTTDKGLHIVSIYNGPDRREAKKLLEEARVTLDPGAWIKHVN